MFPVSGTGARSQLLATMPTSAQPPLDARSPTSLAASVHMVHQAHGGGRMPLGSAATTAGASPATGRLATGVLAVGGMQSGQAFATQASQGKSGSAVIEHGAAPPAPKLTAVLDKTLNDLKPGFFDHRPKLVKGAVERLQPLAVKPQLTRQDLLTLIDATCILQCLPQEKQGRLTRAQHESIAHLAGAVDTFVGPASALRASLDKLSGDLEARQSVPNFTSYLKTNHPNLLEHDPASGSYRLNTAGQQKYSRIEKEFKSQWKRLTVQPDELNRTDHEKDVAKVIEGEYPRYQKAMRVPDDRIETKRTLIECAQIVESLAQATPERVSSERYATVFPGGIADPLQLVKGREYTEPGIVFVGGERPADKGYRMKINLMKGIPIDARPLYGHHGGDEEKLQWVTLPGAKFRYDGHTGSGSASQKTYEFTQIER